jgi:hypothetical protein
MSKIAMGFRQVHLDFHTSGLIGDVASRFDPDKFAATVQAAHVDSVTCFAKCHHGQLYYNTRHPARHPGLPKGLDLLGEQVKALHRRGIRAPIYISVQCDEYAANTHPEWIVRQPDGTNFAPKPLAAGWQIVDMSSPYADYLAEQTAEIVEKFAPADGIFFDMCWNQPSVSNWAKAAMDALGLDPEKEADRHEYARRLALIYMKRLAALCRKASKTGSVYFNSRPLTLLNQDLDYMTHVEIEALPSGGWGYMYFPNNVRYVRTYGVPYLGMTARFHKSWADFGGLKPEAALKYEVCQMLAHGARCSIGDQMHPRGTLDPVAWKLMGRVYGYAEACQPWCEDATSAAEIGLLRNSGDGYHITAGGVEEGANRLLMQLKQQYDVLDPTRDFARYRLLILPDGLTVDAALARRLDTFVAAGGAVLASGYAGLDAEGRATWKALPVGGQAAPSPFTTTYLRPGKSLCDLLPPTDHVMYERGLRVAPARGAEVLARVVEPYFERSWRHFSSHNQTPPARLTNYPAALVKGRVAYIPYPIFSMYGRHASLAYRALVQGCVGRLLGRPMVEIAAPSFAEVSVMHHGRATVLHVLSWAVERRAANMDLVEDTVPLFNVRLSLALPKAPHKVYLAPTLAPLAFTWTHGRAETIIPRIDGHAMVVFE